MNGFWVGGLNCQLPPERTCTDSVQGVDHGSSLCMDTSEGAQCTVTCMGGAIGEGTFICENGIWVGDLTCQLPPHFSQGQFDTINPDFWNPNPGPSLQTGRTCANSVS